MQGFFRFLPAANEMAGERHDLSGFMQQMKRRCRSKAIFGR